jgi:hypothetical protein
MGIRPAIFLVEAACSSAGGVTVEKYGLFRISVFG